MKKFGIIVLAGVMAFGLSACGSGAKQEETTAAVTEAEEVGVANPWTEVENPDKAAEGAEVGYFMVPADGTSTSGGEVHWSLYQYMKGIAEADGSIGSAELVVRKGLKQDTEDVSGDYTEYSKTWTDEIDGFKISCFGNEDGKAMKVIWLSDNFSYSIMVRGQGDVADTYGIDADAVKALVEAIQ